MAEPVPIVVNKPRILVVEDEAIVASDLRLRLVELGYEPVGHARGGEQAITLAGGLQPDLVLMDIQLAGAMDGIAVAHAIRAQFSLPIVFLTAFAEEDTLARAKLTEPFGYILKPFSERELHTVIELALYKHKAEAHLRESETRFRTLFEQSPDGVLIIDAQTTLPIMFNDVASRQLGCSREEFARLRISDYEAVDRPEAIRSRVERLQGEGRLDFETKHRRKTGELRDVLVTVQPIELSGRRELHCIFRDITERKQLEAQFCQAQKMESVGQLASGIAHDFNNLLTVINGTAELVLAQIRQDDPMHADVEEICLAGERAATLTRQLLAFGRQQLLEPRVLNVNAVVAGMESLLRRLVGENIDLVVVPTPGVGNVRADPGQLEQVITNLVVNARDAMPQGGRLMIETENVEIDEAHAGAHGEAVPPGAYVRLTVSDSGVGMDEATRVRIFEPFFTTKGPGIGTGLGLSTVFGIVRQSQGFIWVDSERGRGTRVEICLPHVPEAAGTVQSRPAVASSAGTETILLVEDNAGLRKLAMRVLRPVGYTVLEAATGEEALTVLARQDAPVHLLLTDVVMPGMSGRELAERLAETHPAMKVLYMSGYTADTIVRHGVLDAQMPFLHKPFTAAALLQEVREVLDSPA